MSEVLELRRGSNLSQGEKNTIISSMVSAGDNKSIVRARLANEYNITEGSITSLLAHDTMRRQREQSGESLVTPETVQGYTQDTVYAITSISGLDDTMRDSIFTEFRDIANEHAGETGYDYYEDIGAISDCNDIDPTILEEYLRIRFKWLGVRLDSLKKNENTDKLTYEDKMIIRDYVEIGVDKADKKKRRKEMVKKYGVSIFVIGAITAWKKGEDGNVTLGEKTAGVSAIPTIPDEVNATSEGIPEIRDVVSKNTETLPGENPNPEIISPEVQNSDNGNVVNPTGSVNDSIDEQLDSTFILEFAEGYDLQNDTERGEFLDDVFDCFPDATLEDIKRIIPDFPDDKTHTNQIRSGEGMGALIEYNNEIKNKWRQKLKEFIDENTDIEKRKDMKVLCLPGLKCLEIPLYLELGFRPENIVGVEAGIVKGKKDPELIRQFEENAKKYGIQTRIGKLEKILETEETVFDVVSLDFLCGWDYKSSTILSTVKKQETCIILTNFQGRRDATLKRYHLSHQSRKHPSDLSDKLERIEDKTVASIQKGIESGAILSEVRNELLTGIISGEISRIDRNSAFFKKVKPFLIRSESRGLDPEIFDIKPGTLERVSEDDYPELVIAASLEDTYIEIVRSLHAAYAHSKDMHTRGDIDRIANMFYFLHGKIITSRETIGLRRYKYFGEKGTPMFSDFFLSKNRHEDYSVILPYTRFIAACIDKITDIKGRGTYYFDVVRKTSTGGHPSDILVLRKGSTEVGKIVLGNLLACCHNWNKKYPLLQKLLTETREVL